MKPRILIFCKTYSPGYLGGGPIRSIENLIDWLGDELEIMVYTSDTDLNQNTPYFGITSNQWCQVGKAKIFYSSTQMRSLNEIRKILNQTQYDILYLNSYFEFRFSILPCMLYLLKLIPKCKIVLAPRGEFSNGALRIKSFKKHIFIWFSKIIGLHQSCTWQASTNCEVIDILRELEITRDKILIASDLLPRIRNNTNFHLPSKSSKILSILYLSRINEMKNLHFALNVLKEIEFPILFNIYGPIENDKYWRHCLLLIRSLPSHISVNYNGPINHKFVLDTIGLHDLMFLPTFGENFGHVIVESWSVGVPVLISDQTPWIGLKESGLGWDISLDKIELFIKAISEFNALDLNMRQKMYLSCLNKASEISSNESLIIENKLLFLANT